MPQQHFVICVLLGLLALLNGEMLVTEFNISTSEPLLVFDNFLTKGTVVGTNQSLVPEKEEERNDIEVIEVPEVPEAPWKPLVEIIEEGPSALEPVEPPNVEETEPSVEVTTAKIEDEPELTILKVEDQPELSILEVEEESEPVIEQVVIIYAEMSSTSTTTERPPGSSPTPDWLSNFWSSYYSADDGPIIIHPHHLKNKWAQISQKPSYTKYGFPMYYRGGLTPSDKERGLSPEADDHPANVGDDVNLTRKEIMKRRLNSLRISKMLPELHSKPPRATNVVVQSTTTGRPTNSSNTGNPKPVPKDSPRKVFDWSSWWPFSYFNKEPAKVDPVPDQAVPVKPPLVPVVPLRPVPVVPVIPVLTAPAPAPPQQALRSVPPPAQPVPAHNPSPKAPVKDARSLGRTKPVLKPGAEMGRHGQGRQAKVPNGNGLPIQFRFEHPGNSMNRPALESGSLKSGRAALPETKPLAIPPFRCPLAKQK